SCSAAHAQPAVRRACRARSAATSTSRSTSAARDHPGTGCSKRPSVETARRRSSSDREATEGGGVQFITLIHTSEAPWETFSDEEKEGWYERYRQLMRDAEAAGVLAGGHELAATRHARPGLSRH